MKTLLLGCASALALTLVASGAYAQDESTLPPQVANPKDATDVGEVVITARKRAERLRDVPVAASVIDNEQVERRGGVSDVETLFSTVPGLRYFNTSTPANSEISLRSSGTSRGTSAEAAVGLYVNGAYVGGGGNLGGRNFSGIDLFDIGRVEVLRGTQAALYGRNAVGGAINVISAQPTYTYGGYADVKYGINNEKLQTQLVVNVPINDAVAVRLGVNYFKQTGGFFYNPDHDKYFDAENGVQYRAQIHFKHERFDLNVLGELQLESVPSLAWQVVIAPGSSGYPNGYVQNKYVYPWNTSPTAKQNVGMFQTIGNYAFDNSTLTGTFMYRKRKSLSSYDTDSFDQAELDRLHSIGSATASTDANAGNENHNLAESLYGDLHWASDKSSKLTWLFGVEALQIKQFQENFTTRTPTKANASTGNRTPSHYSTVSYSAYGSLGYQVTDQLSVTAEGRYFSDTRKLIDTNRYDRLTGVVIANNLIGAAENDPTNFSYNLVASYKPDSNWLLYGKVGTSFRAGGFNNNQGDPRQPIPIPASYNDEQSLAWEVGAKGNITRHIYVTAAYYRNKISDFMVQLDNGCKATNPACPIAATSFLTNAGDADLWGAELEVVARYRLFDGDFTLNSSVARQDGKVVSGPYQGRKIPQTSEWNGSLALNYQHAITGDISGFGNIAYQFQSGGVQEIEQTPPLYDRDSADVRLGVNYGKIQLSTFATNVANRSDIIYTTDTVRRWNQKRVYGVQLRYRW